MQTYLHVYVPGKRKRERVGERVREQRYNEKTRETETDTESRRDEIENQRARERKFDGLGQNQTPIS